MTLEGLLQTGTRILDRANVEEASLDSWYLMEFCFQINRVTYYLECKKEITKEQEQKYLKLIEKRATHIPLQYITGQQEFMGFSFLVNENVLIPRQDTEILVEELLLVSKGKEVLDMCTGSGCIILSLSQLCPLKRAAGVDISEKALCVAKKNQEHFQEKVEWIHSNLFEMVQDKFDIIVSNPPYIETKVIEELMPEVKIHEPRMALDGKEDGLYFYTKIIKDAHKYLKDNGMLYFEIGYNQASQVRTLLEQNGFHHVKIKQDLSGLDRVIYAKKA